MLNLKIRPYLSIFTTVFLPILAFGQVFPISQTEFKPGEVLICETAFEDDLFFSRRGPDVIELQKILNISPDTRLTDVGPGSPGGETDYFGPLTHNAVVRFQEKYAAEILVPAETVQGTGFVGAYTRRKVSEVCLALAQPQFDPSFSFPVLPIFQIVAEQASTITKEILSFVAAAVLVLGVNFTLWGLIGFCRVVVDGIKYLFSPQIQYWETEDYVKENEVAVIVPAHNEELVISDTLSALLPIVEASNIFIVSDGSKDRTAEIARQYNVNVLELNPGRGKAGALEAGLKHFEIAKKYKAVILVDADTRLKKDYLKKALPFFNDEKVVAVAGYAATIWNPKHLSWKQILFISHRDRIYFLTQRLVKFGQTWKYTNVTPIVPGFASIYRTSILDRVNLNPPGLVIEDFNMTFEVHHKNLGKIAHHPDVVAYTQDPDNARDYFRQIKRWHLGFWQTIRLHGFWAGKFWAAMTITLADVIIGSVVFLFLPIFLLVLAIPSQSLPLLPWSNFAEWRYLLLIFLVGVWLIDYLLTIIVAIFQRRKEYLSVGLLFPIIRFLDAAAFLSAIPRAFLVKSSGRWVSPTRRTN